MRQRRDILGHHIRAPLQNSADFAAQNQLLTGARSRPPTDQLTRKRQRLGIIRPTTTHQIQHVRIHVIGYGHLTHDLLALNNFITVDHRPNGVIMHAGGAADDFRFLIFLGIIDLYVKQKRSFCASGN